MKKIERRVAKSSFGTKAVTAARASVPKTQAERTVTRAAQIRAQKSSGNRAPK